uniref:Uncharacterized protein n=1 Tax=Opuntia streptacantha TaxID=393608 RepID=A0A7C9DJY9_OPUST
MGRGRGKGKKQTAGAGRDDLGSGEEEKIPAYKRRGRPHKPLKDEVEEDEQIDQMENDDENAKSPSKSKASNIQIAADNGTKRRRRSSQVKENSDSIKEENGSEDNAKTEDSIKPVGFRQNGSRRKSKPHRAAEVGVECK